MTASISSSNQSRFDHRYTLQNKDDYRNKYLRQSLRIPNYDYTQPGAYFITIATAYKQEIFGIPKENGVILNKFGDIAFSCWIEISNHFPHTKIDEFIIMPNHIHGIIWITGNQNSRNTACCVSTVKNIEKFGKPVKRSILLS